MKNRFLAASALIALSALIISAASAQSLDPHAHETKAQRDARMHWWREAKFGMFIHWGLYAHYAGSFDGKPTGGAGEWIMHDEKIPVADYAAGARAFDPERFDAKAVVGIAKAAGMKYIVMTAKHHEGFAMFRTATDGYNIHDATPFKRDPIAEMSAACKRAGIKFGVYYSQAQDWHHPGGAAYGGHWDPAQDGDLHEYVRTIAAPQVRELLTKYHPAVLWWDTQVDMSPADIKALTAAFPDDPGLIANNRLGNGVAGDTETPEQSIPATGFKNRDWETCMTINDTWGYKSQDTDFKSTETLLHDLIDIASKGGNYLLNVGPDGSGVIPAPEAQRLKAMGKWLSLNGTSIYGTTASPFKRLPFDGRATVKGNTLYLNVFQWPDSGLMLTGLETPVTGAKALATGEKLMVRNAADGTLTISKPARLDPESTTIALTLSGSPSVTEAVIPISPLADGSYSLTATTSTITGEKAQVEGNGDTADIGYWTDAKDTAEWSVQVSAANAGNYQVSLDYACESNASGSEFKLQLDGNDTMLTGTVGETGGWGDYWTLTLDGTIALPVGTHRVKVVPVSMPGYAVMNLRRLKLAPVAP